MTDEDSRTVWVGNLDSNQVTEDILFELFHQAGPVQYVRIPKDKETGRLKSFAFVIFRDAVSVPYVLELMNGVSLFNRNLRVQSRQHQELKEKGLATGPGGIHSLNPDFNAHQNSRPQAQTCSQQSSLLGMPNFNIHNMGGHNLMGHNQAGHNLAGRNLMGHNQAGHNLVGHNQAGHNLAGYNLMGHNQAGHNLVGHMVGGRQIPPHLLALAQQRMSLMQSQQPVPLSSNPMMNAPSHRTSDRYGSTNQRYNPDHSRRNYNDREGGSSTGDRGYSRQYDNGRGNGGSNYVDNNTMKSIKAQFDRGDNNVNYNSNMLSHLQQKQGRFDYSRLSQPSDNNKPYDRHHSDRGSRHHDSRSHHSSSHDRSSHGYHRSHDSSRSYRH